MGGQASTRQLAEALAVFRAVAQRVRGRHRRRGLDRRTSRRRPTLLLKNALASDVIQRACTRPHWRESYVGTVQEDGTILEGFVGLIYREDDGSLEVFDYKTDDLPPEALQTWTDYYRPQPRAYKTMLHDAPSDAVPSTLLFLTPSTSQA